MKSLRFLLLATLFALFLAGCNRGAESPYTPTEEEIMEIYDLYLEGDYASFVSEMQSCDNKPENYRKQMRLLLQQHAVKQKEENGGAKSASVSHVEMHDSGRVANVFLDVVYGNKSQEEIMLPLVFVEGRWRVR